MTRPLLIFEIPEGTRPAHCRACAEPIFFIPRIRQPEKKHPVNADGSSHFASCPHADDFRKKKEKA